MGSARRPHVVLVPFPAHGHVAPHAQLARVLHARGAHVTLVHTELHHRRLLRARGGADGSAAAAAAPETGLGIEVIPDGLSLEDPPRTLEAHHEAMEHNCLEPFKALLRELRDRPRPAVPPVSCVVADTAMPFAAVAAREVGVPDVQFFTASACGLMGYLQFGELKKRELIPLKDDYKTDGSLDTPLDWVPGMKGVRLRDLPTFCHTTDADGWLMNFLAHQMRVADASKAVVLNTFYDIERDVLDELAPLLPPIYTVGPLASVCASLPAGGGGGDFKASDASSLQEDEECISWLDGRAPRSVVYVSFGSHAKLGGVNLREFASGLARCGSPYLWVLRPDMAADIEVGEDGLVVPWCAQETVLGHPSVGLFVTHCGWNSILESVVPGVPVIGYPVIAEQTTNCRQACETWRIGAELPQEAGSAEIAALVREMMVGRKGKEAREKALEWKRLAEVATKQGGSSHEGIDRLVDEVLLPRRCGQSFAMYLPAIAITHPYRFASFLGRVATPRPASTTLPRRHRERRRRPSPAAAAPPRRHCPSPPPRGANPPPPPLPPRPRAIPPREQEQAPARRRRRPVPAPSRRQQEEGLAHRRQHPGPAPSRRHRSKHQEARSNGFQI